ncbi:MAG TPA: LptF/LptG family permease, partial [Gammaproteobacteria bacterium]
LGTAPWVTGLADRVLLQARSTAVLSALAPGRFTEAGRDVVYHVQASDAGSGMRGVFVHIQRPDGDLVIRAARARLEFDAERGDRYLVLEQGSRYDGTPGQGDYRVYAFDRYRVHVDSGRPVTPRANHEALSTAALWQAGSAREQAELHWRLALPLAVPVLALLAVPVSHARPRQGRYARLLLALLLFVVYYNALGGVRTLLAGGQWPAWLGLWPVHALPLLLGWALLRRQLGRPWLPFRRG